MDELYVIFGRDECYYTESAKSLAEELRLNYKYYKVPKIPSSDIPEPFKTMAKENNRTTVPCIFKVQLIGGYDNFSAILGNLDYSSSDELS